MASDQIENLRKVTVSTTYGAGDTSIVLSGGEGAELPDPADGNYNLVWWDSSTFPDPADDPNVEIVRVTALATDTLTVVRAQEGTAATTKNTASTTYTMFIGPTVKNISDVDHDPRINQAAHGFTNGQVVYHNGAIYALADASLPATAESIGFVDDVSSAGDHFTLRTGGRITGLSGLTTGEAHFLSETAGAITVTAPSTVGTVIKPVLIADSTTSGFIFNMRGTVITTATVDSNVLTFTSASGEYAAGIVTHTHNLGEQYVQVQIYDENDQLVSPDDVTATSTTVTTIDLTSWHPISGTWHSVIKI